MHYAKRKSLADDSLVSAFEAVIVTLVAAALIVAPLATARFILGLLEQTAQAILGL